MDSKQKLERVLEYFINGEKDKATELFKEYMVESAAEIYQTLDETEEDVMEMEREVPHNDMGDDLADEIEANKDEIASEEMMGEDADDVIDLDDEDDLMDLEDLQDEVADIKDEVSDLHDEGEELDDRFSKLEKAFDEIKNTEEVEHGEDFDHDGEIGSEEHNEEGDVAEAIDEAIEMTPVKVDMKDKTGKHASPVAAAKDRLGSLGGEPVKVVDKGHKGFDREEPSKKPGMVTKETNTVKDIKAALKKVSVDAKDKAPHAGASPAMPKKK